MGGARDFELVERNLRVSMQAFSRCHSRGETKEFPGVVVSCCGCDYPLFNSALLTESVREDLPRRIEVAADYFRARQFGWAFWICEDMLDSHSRRHSKDFFLNRGFQPVVEAPGMIAGRIPPPRRRLPVLEYQQVCAPESRTAFCHLISMVFDIPFQVCVDVYGCENIWDSRYQGWLGLAGGRAISAAVVVISDGVAGLYSVATTPELQGMGYGEATVRHALHRAQHDYGVDRFILQSTRAGLALYRRLGFQTVTRFSLYQFKPK